MHGVFTITSNLLLAFRNLGGAKKSRFTGSGILLTCIPNYLLGLRDSINTANLAFITPERVLLWSQSTEKLIVIFQSYFKALDAPQTVR